MAAEEDAEWSRARREAAATLQGALSWKLPEARWEQVRAVLTELTAAVAAPTPSSLWEATETLGLFTPVRVGTRLGEKPDEPAPGIVREQIAALVDTLQPRGSKDQKGTGLLGGRGQAAKRGT